MEEQMKRKFVYLGLVVIILAGLYYLTCTVRTPAIEGIVIDKETKEPVENAWIMATIGTATATFGGEAGMSHLLNRPHTRTDKDGRFAIPSHFFTSPPPPVGFGMRATRLRIDAYAPGGRRGAIDIDAFPKRKSAVPQDPEAVIRPKSSFKVWKLMALIPVRQLEMTLEDTREELRQLAGFCGDGRYYFAWPTVRDSCDVQELDYLIDGSERLLTKMTGGATLGEAVLNGNHMTTLAVLYEKKGDYERARKIYVRAYEFEQQHGLMTRLDQYKNHMKELDAKITNRRK
jgi:hypothetical protein